MKILIADKLDPAAIDALNGLGADITSVPDMTAEEIPATIGDAEILIVRSTKVTADAIAAGKALSVIIRAGAGVNTIDLEAADKSGIHVANCPGKNSDAVAELAIGLMIAADRRIAFATADMVAGEWKKKEYAKAAGLKDRTLGVVGVGTIGKAVIKHAQDLEMNVVAWSRSLTHEKAEAMGVEYAASALDVAKLADVISLHIAVTPETKHIVNAEFLGAMKDGAILVNTARGEVIDTVALKAAIASKGLRVALDVFENEPKGGVAAFEDIDLAKLVTCTPHVGASTDQSTESIAAEVVRIVEAYKESGIPLNAVNIRQKSSAVFSLVVRHLNKVGVLSATLDLLTSQDINIEEMQNLIFEGGHTATCSLKLDKEPSAELIATLNSLEGIIKAGLT